MIVTVTCNPAIDVTYAVEALAPGEVHRVHEVSERAGGKGVNVARVLQTLGADVMATGLADAGFAASLPMPARFVPALPAVRRTLVVHDPVRTTSLWEPGYRAAPDAEAALLAVVEDLLATASVLVVSGSLPPGVAASLPVRLARAAAEVGALSILDLDGEALKLAAEAGGSIVTPNRDEIHALLGPIDDLADAARGLHRRTGSPVVFTLGAAGAMAAVGDQVLHAQLRTPVHGNPTGAGDALVAGLARGLRDGREFHDVLTDAVALGGAAVLSPLAGQVDPAAWQHLRRQVDVTAVTSFPMGAA